MAYKIRAIHVFIFLQSCFVFNKLYAQSDTLKEHLVLESLLLEGVKTFSTIKIDSSELMKYHGQTAEELLSRNGGVFVKQYGAGNLATLSIRGSSANQTQIFWNEIPVNSATLGLTDLTLLPIDFYNTITLQKGGSSLSSGSGGIGGAVCLSSNTDHHEKFFGSAEQILGSFGIKRTLFKLNYGNERMSFISGYLHRFAFNDFTYKDITSPSEEIRSRENASINQHYFMQEGLIRINQNSQFDFKINYLKSWRQIPSIIGITNNGQFQNDEQIKTMLGFKKYNDKWSHQFKLAYVNEFMSYQDTAYDILSEFDINSFHANYKTNRYFSKLKAKFQLYIMNRMDMAESDYFNDLAIQKRSSGYLKWEHEIGRTVYHLAVREELIDFKTKPITPSLGLKRAFFKNEIGHSDINFSKTSRYPTLNDQFWMPGGNLELLPEMGFEIEWNNSMEISKHIKFSGSAFYGETKNWILWLPANSGNWSPQNIKEIQRYGLELKTNYDKNFGIFDLSIEFQYNFLKAISIDSYIENDASIGKQLMYVPNNQAQFNVDLTSNGVRIYYQQSAVGRVFLDGQNESYLPYYLPADLGIEWTSKFIEGKQVVAGLKIINIFNEDYHVISYRPMPRAYVLFNLKINLKNNK